VELTTIPAVAYRQKLPAGGSGVTICRYGEKQVGIASISTRSGKAIPAENNPAELYPAEAFNEAIELTRGLPYKKLGKVTVLKKSFKEAEPKAEEEEIPVDLAAYDKLAAKYTDKTGKLSYELINKDLIKLLKSSSVARKLVADKATPTKIKNYVVGAKFRDVTKKELTDKQVKQLSDMLDNVYPKGVFKELSDEIRKALAQAKQ
jgi:hypothetical protein